MEDRKAGLVKVRNNAAVTETEKIPVDSKTVAKVVSLLEKSNIPFNKQQFLGMIFFQLNGKEDFFSFPTTCGLASITFACNSNAGSTASIEIKGMQSRSGIEYPIFFDSLPDELKSQALQDCYANILQIPVGKLDIFKQLVAVVDGQQAVECLMKNEFSLDIKYRGKKLSDRNVQAAAEDPINRVPRNIENLFIRLALQLPEDQHWCQNVLKEVYLFERVGNIFNVVTLMIPYEILSLDLSIIDRDKKLKENSNKANNKWKFLIKNRSTNTTSKVPIVEIPRVFPKGVIYFSGWRQARQDIINYIFATSSESDQIFVERDIANRSSNQYCIPEEILFFSNRETIAWNARANPEIVEGISREKLGMLLSEGVQPEKVPVLYFSNELLSSESGENMKYCLPKTYLNEFLLQLMNARTTNLNFSLTVERTRDLYNELGEWKSIQAGWDLFESLTDIRFEGRQCLWLPLKTENTQYGEITFGFLHLKNKWKKHLIASTKAGQEMISYLMENFETSAAKYPAVIGSLFDN